MLWCGRSSTSCSNRHMAKGVWGICPGLPSLLYIWPPGSFLRRNGGAVFVLLSALRYAPSAPSGRARCCTGRLSSPARPALCWGRCWSKQLAILAPLGCQKQKEAWESAPRLLVFFFDWGGQGCWMGAALPCRLRARQRPLMHDDAGRIFAVCVVQNLFQRDHESSKRLKSLKFSPISSIESEDWKQYSAMMILLF